MTSRSRLGLALSRPYRYLFGEDVFISYSRADAATYAAVLANLLSDEGFSVFLDQWETEPGVEIPRRILRVFQRGSMLVVVASLGAANAMAIGRELREFLASRRQVLPINIAGALQTAAWEPLVRGAAVSSESDENLSGGTPAAEGVNRIEQSARFRKRTSHSLQRPHRWCF